MISQNGVLQTRLVLELLTKTQGSHLKCQIRKNLDQNGVPYRLHGSQTLAC